VLAFMSKVISLNRDAHTLDFMGLLEGENIFAPVLPVLSEASCEGSRERLEGKEVPRR
jgi:hypothetical protein